MFREHLVSGRDTTIALRGTCVLQIIAERQARRGDHRVLQSTNPGTLLFHPALLSITRQWADPPLPEEARLPATAPGTPRSFPLRRAPSSHPASSAAAASSASSSRNVSSEGSYTSLKAPRPTCPYSGVGRLGAAIFFFRVLPACV